MYQNLSGVATVAPQPIASMTSKHPHFGGADTKRLTSIGRSCACTAKDLWLRIFS